MVMIFFFCFEPTLHSPHHDPDIFTASFGVLYILLQHCHQAPSPTFLLSLFTPPTTMHAAAPPPPSSGSAAADAASLAATLTSFEAQHKDLGKRA